VAALWALLPAAADAADPAAENPNCTNSGWQAVGPFTVYDADGARGPAVFDLAIDRAQDLAVAGLDLTTANNLTFFEGKPTASNWTGSGDLSGVAVAATVFGQGPGLEVWAGGIGENGKAYLGERKGGSNFSFTSQFTNDELDKASSLSMASGSVGVVAVASRADPLLPVALVWAGGVWSPFGDLSDVHSSGAGARLLWDVEVGPDGRGWLAVNGRGLWRLDQPAGKWLSVGDDGMRNSTLMSVLVDPQNGNRLWAGLGPSFTGGAYQRGLRVSTDGGESWGVAQLTDAVAVMAMAITADETKLYAGTWGDGLWLSRDAGETWGMIPGPPSLFVRRLVTVVPKDFQAGQCELLFAGTDRGLYVRNMAQAVDYRIFLPMAAQER
jgi:hypothetical protein